jgi:pimeloyl-ACP methyl ester carboxylesterase
MKLKLLLCCLVFLTGRLVSAQYIEKTWFDKSDSVYGYYTVIKPSSGRVQGALLLLDGYGGNADNFFAETKIHNVAWANDLLTVGIPTGTRLYADTSMLELLNRIAKDILRVYDLRKDQFAIGGLSSGGTIALRYAELCHEKPAEFPILPVAVFAVDSPVDLVGLYKSSERDLQKNNGGWWLGEAKMITDRFKNELGDPGLNLEKYREVSPLLREAKDTSNEWFLAGTAVRTYHDVDVSWFIQNRGRSLYETNMLDGSELISRLVALGNQQAEFIASKIPGRRSNGYRHPHSWNIADEIDLVQWLKEKLNFYPDHLAAKLSYTAPAGWTNETILFPMNFAPGLAYKGFEELRFAPGWGNADSPEKWAYTILWWLDGAYPFNETILQQSLENYYTGLTRQQAVAAHLDLSAWSPSKVTIQAVKTAQGDKATYTGTASFFDAYVTRKPETLYLKIHLKACAGKARTMILFEVAAHPFTQPVWQQLDRINQDFRCEK